jgi:hypothetical protein
MGHWGEPLLGLKALYSSQPGRARSVLDRIRGRSRAGLHSPKAFFFDNPKSIPKMLEFTVQNPGEADIHIFSMFCGDVHFHPVLFQPKVVPSNEAIILQLLFLLYHIESSVFKLVFATSSGQF